MADPIGPTDRIATHPEFYADVIAAGGLVAALTRAAEDLGLEIGAVEPPKPGHTADARIASPRPAGADLTVTAHRARRLFRVDNNESGVANARGSTTDLSEVAKAAAAWYAGADPRGMQATADFIELPLMAEARAARSASAIVDLNWRGKQRAWGNERRRFEAEDWQEPVRHRGLRVLLDAVMEEPRLRRLYGVTSHYNLWFSACTEYPFAPVGAYIAPLTNGGYNVIPRQGHKKTGDIEFFETAHAAAARAAELLPETSGPAVFGTADLPA